jgi:hypothetical protein
VELFQTGVASKPGGMYLPRVDYGQRNNFGAITLSAQKPNGKKLGIPVEVTVIDSLKLDRCDLIKVDAEGMDLQAIQGADHTISRCRPVMAVECNTLDAGWPIVLHMRKLRYVAFLHAVPAFNPDNFNKNPSNWFGNCREASLLFIPDERRLELQPVLAAVDAKPEPIVLLDDLVRGMLKKPQYRQTVTSELIDATQLSSGLADMQGAKNDILRATTELTETRSALAIEMLRLANDLTRRQTELTGKEQELATRQQKLESAQQELNRQQMESLARQRELDAKAQELIGKAKQLGSEGQELSRKQRELERQEEALTRGKQEHTLELVRKARELGARELRVVENARELAENEQALIQQHRELADREQAVAGKEGELTGKGDELTGKERELAEKDREFAAREKDLLALRKEVRSFQAWIEEQRLRWKRSPLVLLLFPFYRLLMRKHWATLQKQARRRRLMSSSLFDVGYYLKENPDVAAAGLNPLDHYLEFGWKERRKTHLLFDSVYYLKNNPDAANADVDPVAHYLEYGWKEGRNPHPLFDTNHYLKTHPDLAHGAIDPLTHYLEVGWKQGRNPHALFDTAYYLQRVGDMAQVVRTDPLTHYLEQGSKAGLSPHPLFDVSYYLIGRPQLDGAPALVHYLSNGTSGNPHPLFDGAYYLEQNPEVARGGINPLLHYVSIGTEQGRSPHPLFSETLVGAQVAKRTQNSRGS